jgi:aryl-alcohol dehydrogenase-like predicted oxidoreductase
MSHKTVAGGLQAVDACDAVMTTLNVDDQAALGVVERAHARGCGVLVKKALASGAVARDPARRRASLEFVATTPGVSSIVVGTTDMIHLRENVAALEHLPDVF